MLVVEKEPKQRAYRFVRNNKNAQNTIEKNV